MILKDLLSKEKYDHFLLLSLSLRVLVSEKLMIKYNVYAENVLSRKQFIIKDINIYGATFAVPNVHMMEHIVDDSLR